MSVGNPGVWMVDVSGGFPGLCDLDRFGVNPTSRLDSLGGNPRLGYIGIKKS